MFKFETPDLEMSSHLVFVRCRFLMNDTSVSFSGRFPPKNLLLFSDTWKADDGHNSLEFLF